MSKRTTPLPEFDRDARSEEAVAIAMGWMLRDERVRRFIQQCLDGFISERSPILTKLYEKVSYSDQRRAEALFHRRSST